MTGIERTKQDHNTPGNILRMLRKIAPITCDPCSNPWSRVGTQGTLPETPFLAYSKHNGEDGLNESWYQGVPCEEHAYFNPPYKHISPWFEKAYLEHSTWPKLHITGLVPCSPETGWARFANLKCVAWADPPCRLSFIGAGGNGAKQPTRIYYLGPRPYLFADVLHTHGASVYVRPFLLS